MVPLTGHNSVNEFTILVYIHKAHTVNDVRKESIYYIKYIKQCQGFRHSIVLL